MDVVLKWWYTASFIHLTVLTDITKTAHESKHIWKILLLTIHLEHVGLGQLLIAVRVTAVVPHVNRSHLSNVERAVIAKVLIEQEEKTE